MPTADRGATQPTRPSPSRSRPTHARTSAEPRLRAERRRGRAEPSPRRGRRTPSARPPRTPPAAEPSAAEPAQRRASRTAAEPAAAARPSRRRRGRRASRATPPRPRQAREARASRLGRSRARGRRRPKPAARRRPGRTRPTPCSRSLPMCRQRGRRQRLLDQPGRPRGVPRLRRDLAQRRSRSAAGSRTRSPSWSRSSPRISASGSTSTTSTPSSSRRSLESVISSCVNFVGVDLNTASVPLLRHVSGLNQLTARRIVDYRKEHGPFADREQLHEVEGIGPATFTQAAGFLKIRDGEQPARPDLGPPRELPGRDQAAREARVRSRGRPRQGAAARAARQARRGRSRASWPASWRSASSTLRDIFEALARPERDPRDDLPKPIFKKGILKIEDLTAGHGAEGNGARTSSTSARSSTSASRIRGWCISASSPIATSRARTTW